MIGMRLSWLIIVFYSDITFDKFLESNRCCLVAGISCVCSWVFKLDMLPLIIPWFARFDVIGSVCCIMKFLVACARDCYFRMFLLGVK